jgi:hypothetical protein
VPALAEAAAVALISLLQLGERCAHVPHGPILGRPNQPERHQLMWSQVEAPPSLVVAGAEALQQQIEPLRQRPQRVEDLEVEIASAPLGALGLQYCLDDPLGQLDLKRPCLAGATYGRLVGQPLRIDVGRDQLAVEPKAQARDQGAARDFVRSARPLRRNGCVTSARARSSSAADTRASWRAPSRRCLP